MAQKLIRKDIDKNKFTFEFVDVTEEDFLNGDAVKSKDDGYIYGKTLYQMCLMAMRYGIQRNNHLQPDSSIDNIKEVLGALGQENEWAKCTANQLIEEIEWESRFMNPEAEYTESNKKDLENFVKWLKDFLKKE